MCLRATRARYPFTHDVEHRISHGLLIIRAVRSVPPVDQAVDVAKRNLHSHFPQAEEIIQVLSEA